MKSVAFICKYNPMSYAGNKYRMLLNDKNEFTIKELSLKEMIDVRDKFKECQGFSREEVERFIETVQWLIVSNIFDKNK